MLFHVTQGKYRVQTGRYSVVFSICLYDPGTSVNESTDYGMKERVSFFGRRGGLFHANMTEVAHWTNQPCIPWLTDAISFGGKAAADFG